jgi:predicted sugar kinase
VGQSSWGPAVYGIVGDKGAAGTLAAKVRGIVGPGGTVYDTGFSTAGARVWRASASVSG